jgi:hypothetical protein
MTSNSVQVSFKTCLLAIAGFAYFMNDRCGKVTCGAIDLENSVSSHKRVKTRPSVVKCHAAERLMDWGGAKR